MKKLVAIALALTLLLTIMAGVPASAQEPTWPPLRASEHCKVTGGGEGEFKYKFEESKAPHRISFGFTAISTAPPGLQEDDLVVWPAKGQFQLIDHTTKEKVRGTFSRIVWEEREQPQPRRIATGECSFGGVVYDLAVEALDAGEPGVGDWVRIELIEEGEIIHSWVHELEGGNIQIKHKGALVDLET